MLFYLMFIISKIKFIITIILVSISGPEFDNCSVIPLIKAKMFLLHKLNLKHVLRNNVNGMRRLRYFQWNPTLYFISCCNFFLSFSYNSFWLNRLSKYLAPFIVRTLFPLISISYWLNAYYIQELFREGYYIRILSKNEQEKLQYNLIRSLHFT